MKRFIGSLVLMGVTIGVISSQSTQKISAKTKYYTNPSSLRRHNWYGHTNMYTGKWQYNRIHFAKHSVYWATKTSKSGKWHNYHTAAKFYYIKKHGNWYEFGTRESDDVSIIQKPNYRYIDGHKKLVIGLFDPSNDRGGYQTHAPYTVWDFTTKLTDAQNWYHTTNSRH